MYVKTNKFNVRLMSSSILHAIRAAAILSGEREQLRVVAGHLPVLTSVQFSRVPTACVGTRRVVYRENRDREHPVTRETRMRENPDVNVTADVFARG